MAEVATQAREKDPAPADPMPAGQPADRTDAGLLVAAPVLLADALTNPAALGLSINGRLAGEALRSAGAVVQDVVGAFDAALHTDTTCTRAVKQLLRPLTAPMSGVLAVAV